MDKNRIADDELLNLITEGISDLEKDIDYYKALTELSNINDEERAHLTSIFLDKKKHLEYLENIYYQIKGEKYRNGHKKDKPIIGTNLKQVYKKAMLEELAEIGFIRKIHFAVLNTAIRDMTFEIMSDTNIHSQLLMLLYSERD